MSSGSYGKAPSNERSVIGPATVSVIVAAQINEPGTFGDLVLLSIAGVVSVAHSLVPRVPAEVFAVGILAPTALAIGHYGHLEVAYFLVVNMTLYAAWHLGSTLRAVIIAAVASTVVVVVARVRPDAYSWEPWVAAEIFTLVLGRTLYRQQRLISDLEAAREVLAAQAAWVAVASVLSAASIGVLLVTAQLSCGIPSVHQLGATVAIVVAAVASYVSTGMASCSASSSPPHAPHKGLDSRCSSLPSS